MVLAAGLGTRMMPLTRNKPKPLVEVAGKALLDYCLDEIVAGGLQSAIVNVHYFADQVEAHLNNRRVPLIEISDERAEILETGGGLKKARTKLGSAPFFSTNTDAVFTGASGTATKQLSNEWKNNMLALLLLVPLERTLGFEGNGDFHLHQDHQLTKAGDEAAHYAFTGLQIIHPDLLDGTPDGPFSTRLLWKKAREKNGLYGCIYPHHWLHVGTPKGVQDAEEFLSQETASPDSNG